MAQNVTINGTVYAFPETGEEDWGDVVTSWAVAVSSGLLQKSGGSFILTAEVDFGTNFGIKLPYIKDDAATIAAAGFIRLPNNRVAGDLAWRNNADTGDLQLYTDASDDLIFNQNGTPINISAASSGNVTSPGSSTDNGIATYNGTTGQVIQDTLVTIDDNDNLSAPGFIKSSKSIYSPDGIRPEDLAIGLEFEGYKGGASGTGDALAKFINQGGLINAASLSTADVAAADFDATNKKFGVYSYTLASGNIPAFSGIYGAPFKGSLVSWFRNLAQGDYIAYNPQLGIELFVAPSTGFLTFKITESTAASETAKNTTSVTGASDRSGNTSFDHVTAKWRVQGEGGAGTDLMELEFNGADEGSQVSADTINIREGDGGIWFPGGKRNDPSSWAHEYLGDTLPDAGGRSDVWTLVGVTAANAVSGGVLTIDTTGAAATAQSGYEKTTNIDLSQMTVEYKMRITDTGEFAAFEDARASWQVVDDSMDRGFFCTHSKNAIGFYLTASGADTLKEEIVINGKQWHVYRFTASGSPNPIFKFYIDGVCVYVDTNNVTEPSASEFVRWGELDGTSGRNSSHEWEYFRFDNTGAVAPIAASSQGNLDSWGLVNKVIGDDVITQLQSHKVTDELRS